ncbi:MAG: AraC family transcriptional regulator ligand-binding domain-containing protein [Nannocystaceae bacterium]|nr:AraC family transcriptional regulator ligand-binding domain-containing protein [Nannocystaceae bacterium]
MSLDRHTIQASVLRMLVDAAEEQGVSANAMWTRLAVDRATVTASDSSDPDHVVPLALTDAAWIWGSRLGPSDFALRVGARVDAKSLGLLSYLLAASDTVGDALSQLVRFYPLLSSGTRHRLSTRGDTMALDIELASPATRSGVVESFAASVVVSFLSTESDGAFSPTSVLLRQPPPDHASCRSHERLFGAPVRFGAKRCAVVFLRTALAHPMRGGDPVLAKILEQHAAGQLETRVGVAASLADRVRTCLVEGASGTRAIASRLGLSERSLRRQLAREGTSLADLSARLRSIAALRLLADQSIRLPDVARQLGYCDTSTFSRAFRRWHGVSPRAYAQANATATGSRC